MPTSEIMTAQEFLNFFEHRGHAFRRHPKGGIAIVPTPKLTDDERAKLKLVAADLERLLREREAMAGLKPADAMVLREAQKKFPGSRLVEIRRRDPSHWPALEPPDPVAVEPVASESNNSRKSPPEVDQLPLS